MKVYFGGGQGKRLARKEILQTVGWANTFSLAEGLKVRRRRWKVSSPVARECIEMCTFNCFESIEISLFPLISSRLYSTVRFTFTFPNIYSFLSLSCEFNHLSHIPNCISLYFFTLFYLLFYKISFVLQFASHNYFAICQITYTLISLLSLNIQIKIISYKLFYIPSSFHFIEFNFQDKYLHRITNN